MEENSVSLSVFNYINATLVGKFVNSNYFKTFVMFLSVLLLAFAVSPSISQASAIEYSKEDLKEIQKMEQELKFYFEVVGEFDDMGNYIVKDENLLLEKVAAGEENAIALYELSQLVKDSDTPSYEVYSAASFGTCVVDKFIGSYGNIARQFMTGAIFTYIKTNQYDLAARLIFSTLTKAGLKVNVVGLAAEAAWYGWQCRGAW